MWVRRRPGVLAGGVTPPGPPVREPAGSPSPPRPERGPRGRPGRQLERSDGGNPAGRIEPGPPRPGGPLAEEPSPARWDERPPPPRPEGPPCQPPRRPGPR